MADTIKTNKVLQLVQSFADGDDRTLTIDNPVASISAADVNALSSFMRTNQIVLGDKADAAFTRIKSAQIVETRMTNYDLTD